jgi:3-methyl-2-oxobutanoate hydroxymethyltransferase
MVKLEGGVDMAETTHFLTARGIPVCAHVGLTPQSVHQLGGYRVQGRDDSGATRLIADALAQQEAGAGLIVLEAIPQALAAEVTGSSRYRRSVSVPAGNARARCSSCTTCWTSPSGRKARFVRNFIGRVRHPSPQPSPPTSLRSRTAASRARNTATERGWPRPCRSIR